MKYFSYELTPIPTSIFKENFMGHAVLVHHRRNEVQKERNRQRKVFKVMIQLNKMSRTNVKNLHLIANKKKEPQDWLQLNEDDEVPSQHSKIIVNGGYLLHRVFWKGQTGEEKIKCHLISVKSNYDTVTTVFEGYGQMSTKITNT